MSRPTSKAKRPAKRAALTRDDWVACAFEGLAERGLPALAVDALARRLGVTKGSFYWHFRDADDLMSAVVARWEALCVDGVLADLTGLEGPCAVLRGLITRALRVDDPGRRQRMRAEATLAGVADWHPVVRDAYARITQRRLAAAQALYAAAGLAPDEAARAGRFATMTLLGVYPILLTRGSLSERERDEMAADLCARLLPAACRDEPAATRRDRKGARGARA